jgi:predicted RNA binding protein YcfA (HicA-like mRNA interferase family)
MKSSEFVREIRKKGWKFVRNDKGCHEIYEKNGKLMAIPNHVSHGVGKRVGIEA